MNEEGEKRYPPVFTEIHDMALGINKLSRIMKDSAGASLVLGPLMAFVTVFMVWSWLNIIAFDPSQIGLLVTIIVAAVILCLVAVNHGIRTYRFTVEWERRYVKLKELEKKMVSDLGITLEN